MIAALPDEMGEIIYLNHLDVSNNNLNNLPINITQLTRFTTDSSLDLSKNKLCNLTDSLLKWASENDPDWNVAESQDCNP